MNGGLLLALDGGGTKTHALLADQSGQMLGFGASGPSNPLSVGDKAALCNVLMAGTQAMGAHEVSEVTAIGLYIPGFSSCLEQLPQEWACRAAVWSDSFSAYYGCLGDAGGIVVLAGTGSFALGIDEKGCEYTAGGWGHLLGDEGSGYDIGRRAVRAMLARDEAGEEATRLDGLLMDALALERPRRALRAVYAPDFDRSRMAGLCPLVARCAQLGDPDAADILSEAANALACLAARVDARMGTVGGAVALTGGVARIGEPILRPFAQGIVALCPKRAVVAPLFSPLTGAMLHLMRQNHLDTHTVGDRLERQQKEGGVPSC